MKHYSINILKNYTKILTCEYISSKCWPLIVGVLGPRVRCMLVGVIFVSFSFAVSFLFSPKSLLGYFFITFWKSIPAALLRPHGKDCPGTLEFYTTYLQVFAKKIKVNFDECDEVHFVS